MSDTSLRKKSVAKNTIVLYIRMVVIMIVSLYTSRLVLASLGVNDYGIYNVVGGFVTMFSLLSGSMSTTISRFLTYELGKEDPKQLHIVFCTSVNIQLGLSFIIIVLAEAFGLWFLNYEMNIPEGRMVAANWVFQLSLLAFCINLINVPFNSILIAHEEMTAFAYFSIVESLLKLAVALMLAVSPCDRLVFYAIMLLLVNFIMRIAYGCYCHHRYQESRYRMIFDKDILKDMGSFAGWNYMGAVAYIMRSQGLNVLMNLFFGVAVNAARGIATQVESMVSQFVSNFTMALTPQIIKSYAQDEKKYMHQLVCLGSKYSYFMMLLVVVPIIYESPILLELWLGNVPEFTILFLRLTLLVVLFDTLSDSLSKAMLATKNIKKFHIYVSGLVIMVFPISYILYLCGLPVYTCYMVCIAAMIGKLFFELPLLQGMVGLPVRMYLKDVIYRVIPVSIISFLTPYFIYLLMNESIARFFILGTTSVIVTSISIYYLGMLPNERSYILSKVSRLINR